jgi:hypothetical protein
VDVVAAVVVGGRRCGEWVVVIMVLMLGNAMYLSSLSVARSGQDGKKQG